MTDHDPGTDPKYQQRVLGIFQTLAPGAQREGTSIGLGLVKQNVEGYAGTVELESGIGPGCTF
ncbi:MAG TPA: hypothetical protein PKY77_21620 [Phycisphaerae bacterium]|nr:hypothetical protein [Phycisphaerae bacterium]HRY66446.1 hypothetical protein [Phycisphaerae bacterium]HSA25846.1 hypothetical protein [Phycisphaerae bacterium]